ncbi:cholecystokinin receptor type A-like [Ruditapes philippinarum]|uniref:cholecystokinin receptor type A-like n=1 Tax=Ruditapes philippinarum TaxID=129788 RepID=UPI00295A823F|nr:cholecystokinin receptor type A-like [Ruditapes philippinarum]
MMTAVNISQNGEELTRQLKSHLLPVTVFICVEACVGFFGNIAILVVYSKHYRQVNFKNFVLALAFVDLVSCCTALPGEVFSHQNWYDYKYTWVCKVKSYFNAYTALASASILLILAIDRYRKVCHPCAWQIPFHVAFKLCVCCLVISAIVSTPLLLFWGTQTYLYDFKGENVTVSVCEKSGDYAETMYPLLFITGAFLVPISIMIVVLMTLNFTIACRLFGGSIRTEKPTISEKQSSKRTIQMQELSTDILSTDEEFTDDLKGDPEKSAKVSTIKTPSEQKNRNSPRKRRRRRPEIGGSSKFQRKHKTMIMLILTSIFAVTMATYIIFISFVAKPNGILKEMSDSTKPVFFFFWRLYFVNSVVNPILYGFMDPGFRSGFKYYMQRGKSSVTSLSHSDTH